MAIGGELLPVDAMDIAPTVGPGKTAPRLYTDILQYNPFNSGINVLAELPPRFDSSEKEERKDYNRCSHNHVLIKKPRQSDTHTNIREAGTLSRVSSICQKCRQHIDVEIDYSYSDDLSGICPTTYNPLHHFRYDALISHPQIDRTNKAEISGEKDVRCFTCTSPSCKTRVKVTFRSRRITDEFKMTLVDTGRLKARNEQAYQSHPERFPDGIKPPPTPATVLKTMKQVITGVLDNQASPRRIPLLNARFMTQLGREAMPIMTVLGFTVDQDTEELVPPILPDEEGRVDDEQHRILEDWLHEIYILNETFGDSFQWMAVRADNDVKKLLSCADYQSNSRTRTIDLTAPEHPMYGSLGAQSDFADSLLAWAYQRQKICDPPAAPYYFECLNNLANGRNSEELQFEVASLRSQGEYTLSDVRDAYNALNIANNSTDEAHIIGSFNSRVQDAPRQEAPLREALFLIGKSLSSSKIQVAARRLILDVNQAYRKLGVNAETDAEYILTVYNLALSEDAGEEATLREALKAIGEARRDHRLLSVAEAAEDTTEKISVDVAMERLGLQDKSMTDNDIIALYQLRVTDAPSQVSGLRAALKAFADARNSSVLRFFLNTGDASPQNQSGRNDWPVGLENIGNTCYLNSLLQFYFTVQPLRESLLEYEKHQEDEVTEEVLSRKRVGGRKVTSSEIERAKRFVFNLQALFQDMTGSKSTSVTPKKELAYLALINSRDDSDSRRKSVSWNDKDTAGVFGPSLPPHLMDTSAIEEEPLPFQMDIDEKPSTRRPDSVNDAASEDTLVGENDGKPPPYDGDGYVIVDNQVEVLDAKDPISMINEEPVNISNDDTLDMQKTDLHRNDSVMDLDALMDGDIEELRLANEVVMSRNAQLPDSSTVPPPLPERPPPVPPRPMEKHQRRESDLLSFGRQQDVTECIENVMFQIEAALKPKSVDGDGEQQDIIKELFYGKTRQSLEIPGSEVRHKDEYFSHLLVDVAEGSRDIYSALDNIFDASFVDLEGKQARRYVSLSTLPPVLQVQIQRVQFNRTTGQAYKSIAQLVFPESIYLDRYVETDDPALIARREESWRWKEELQGLERRKADLSVKAESLDLREAMETTRLYLEDLSHTLDPEDEDMVVIPPSLLAGLEESKDLLVKEAEEIEDRIKGLQSKLTQQFTDLRKYEYRIHSIFIHRGSVSFGHYWIYIYDFQKGIYRKYNDGYVTEVTDPNEPFSAGEATPYFLVFVRHGQENMMQAVCRQIEERLGG